MQQCQRKEDSAWQPPHCTEILAVVTYLLNNIIVVFIMIRGNFLSKIKDLKDLTGIPLEDLNIEETAVSDLTPLKGMPLRKLYLNQCQVSDLSPLKGMPLKSL